MRSNLVIHGIGQRGEGSQANGDDALVNGIVPSPPEGPAEQQLKLHLLECKPQETTVKFGSKHLGGLTNFWTASLECFGNQELSNLPPQGQQSLELFPPGSPLGEG